MPEPSGSEMSSSSTSHGSLFDPLQRLLGRSRLAGDGEIRLLGEQRLHALAKEGVVVGDEHPVRRRRSSKRRHRLISAARTCTSHDTRTAHSDEAAT